MRVGGGVFVVQSEQRSGLTLHVLSTLDLFDIYFYTTFENLCTCCIETDVGIKKIRSQMKRQA